MNKIYEIGDEVLYQSKNKDGEDRWLRGVIYGIKKMEDPKLNRLTRLTYIIDTGLDFSTDEIITAEDEENIVVRQPLQIEIHPDNIRASTE